MPDPTSGAAALRDAEGADAPRRPFMVANWKMHKTIVEAQGFVEELLGLLATGTEEVDVGVCPAFTALAATAEAASDSAVGVFAQNMHAAPEGAHTGEISAPMLLEVGGDGVVLGHSERRRDNCETDRALAEKVPAALEARLEPILCVGETEEERDAGETEGRLRRQVNEGLELVPAERLGEVTIAYEPVWAIGTGRVATPEQAQEAISFVRALIADRSSEAAERVRILYGGSVKPDNAGEILAQRDVDGALVGGASLEAASFAELVAAAAGR
jgi:triosephosphate isomerase (TIM)